MLLPILLLTWLWITSHVHPSDVGDILDDHPSVPDELDTCTNISIFALNPQSRFWVFLGPFSG